MIVGVDEAGRGPLAGAVVAVALALENEVDLPVKDSKSLSPARRELFFEQIQKNAIFSVALADNKEIDNHNILNATFLAFDRAIKALIAKKSSLAGASFIIDGNAFKTDLAISYQCISKGDQKVAEVAYASIVAKLFRDYLMQVADFCFPRWRFAQHKGYPTRIHKQLIAKHDLSDLHRVTFSHKLKT